MASVFKRKRKVNGEIVEGKKYTIQYLDSDGKSRRAVGYTDKAKSWELAKKLESGEADAQHVRHRNTSLDEHVEAYRRHLVAERNTTQHTSQTIFRIKQAIAGCKWLRTTNMNKTELRDWLSHQREANAFGVQTGNYYQNACKAFGAWLVDANRIPKNPFSGLKPISADDDVRVRRRTLSRDELDRFMQAAHDGETFRYLTGEGRFMLYWLAVTTGLRAAECASLTANSFNFAVEPATVTVEAAYSKNGEKATLPLRSDLAEAFKAWVADYEGKLWPGTWKLVGAKMVRLDLAAARKAWIDEAKDDAEEGLRREKTYFLCGKDEVGQVFDFHSLRHQFLTDLATAKVHPKVAQKLARHSTITLTMDRYSHAPDEQLVAAVESLPNQPQNLTQNLTQLCVKSCQNVALAGMIDEAIKPQTPTPNSLVYKEFGVGWQGSSLVVGAGIEPATHGFSVRCSTN